MAQVGNAKVSRTAPPGAKSDRARHERAANQTEPKIAAKPRGAAAKRPSEAPSRVTSAIVFFREFLRSPAAVGALFPTSAAIGKAITSRIGLESAEFVAEIGAGTGPITKHILRTINHQRCTFFAVEINEKLAHEFRSRFPDVHLVCGDALKLRSLAQQVRGAKHRGHAGLDAVVCAIPVSLLPAAARNALFEEVAKSLKPGGWLSLITYQVPMTPKARELRRALRAHFDEVRMLPPVWGNVPPGFVLQARCRPK